MMCGSLVRGKENAQRWNGANIPLLSADRIYTFASVLRIVRIIVNIAASS